MRRRIVLGMAVFLGLSFLAPADLGPMGCLLGQTDLESYQVYTDHPRLFLRAPRLKLIRRERERDSLRWDQFHLLVSGGAPMPEPGFAYALYFRTTDEEAFARKAIAAALAPSADVRQAALVYDWCYIQLSPIDKQALLTKLRRAVTGKPAGSTLADLRSQLLAAIAIAGDDDAASQAAIGRFIKGEWLGRIIPALKAGQPVIHAEDTYALLEIFHAVRDNLNADLREDFPAFFRQMPLIDLLSYYPPPWPAAENEFHIPFSVQPGEPDLRVAALSRAGELAMVALDTNAPESQVLQGWLMNDRFLLRGTFGIPYEFLWANPYQPGLSYYHVPLVLHDEICGRLLVRSSWEDDALWAGYLDGHLQEFIEGRVAPLDPHSAHPPLDLDEAVIVFSAQAQRFYAGAKEANDIFVVGLEPRTPYHVEVDDEEMREMPSDPGGIVYLKGVRAGVGVRFNRRSETPGPPGPTNR
jgi:hypothetical protein